MDLHLEVVPGLGSLSTRSLAGNDVKTLGGETNGSLDTEVLVLGAVDEISADYTCGAGRGRVEEVKCRGKSQE